MQGSDRPEFETELERLCAGFGVPLTKARKSAFWSGLTRMSLAQFRRYVEIAIGPDAPDDDQPTPKMIWRIHKGAQQPTAKADQPLDADHLEYFANRLMFLHMTHRGGLGSTGRFVPGERHISGMNDCAASDELLRCLKIKRRLVDEFLGYIRLGDPEATPASFVQFWLAELRAVSKVEPRTVNALRASMEQLDALKPFPPSMGRELIDARQHA